MARHDMDTAMGMAFETFLLSCLENASNRYVAREKWAPALILQEFHPTLPNYSWKIIVSSAYFFNAYPANHGKGIK